MMPEATPVIATPLAEENARLRQTIRELRIENARLRGEEACEPCAICVDEPRMPGMLVCSSCRHAQAGSMLHDSLASEVAVLRRQVAALEAALEEAAKLLEDGARVSELHARVTTCPQARDRFLHLAKFERLHAEDIRALTKKENGNG